MESHVGCVLLRNVTQCGGRAVWTLVSATCPLFCVVGIRCITSSWGNRLTLSKLFLLFNHTIIIVDHFMYQAYTFFIKYLDF